MRSFPLKDDVGDKSRHCGQDIINELSRHPPSLQSKASGFSLIEVLIALLILALGVLANAKLQLMSLHSIRFATQQGQAANLAEYIRHKISANPQAQAHYQLQTTIPMTSPVNCLEQFCQPKQLAKYDLAVWQQHVERRLQGGKGLIKINGNKANITLGWPNASNQHSNSCPPQLRHYVCVTFTYSIHFEAFNE
ncbi:type IV pilus modification protein PilV [Thalassotalea maritima]|uniref:type IV pilus modification protein PilV n=1 Tax=Thalassotalea maritima TaxID=3242416 RepID=UPI0035272167